MFYVQLGGVIEPNRQQCYLNAKEEYVESINEVRVILSGIIISLTRRPR